MPISSQTRFKAVHRIVDRTHRTGLIHIAKIAMDDLCLNLI